MSPEASKAVGPAVPVLHALYFKGGSPDVTPLLGWPRETEGDRSPWGAEALDKSLLPPGLNCAVTGILPDKGPSRTRGLRPQARSHQQGWLPELRTERAEPLPCDGGDTEGGDRSRGWAAPVHVPCGVEAVP